MSLSVRVKSSPLLKKIALYLMIPKNEYRPRKWVKWFLNPFKHKKGRGAIVRRRTRMDLFPFNGFSMGKGSIVEDFATVNNAVGDVSIGNETIVGMSCVLIGPLRIGNKVMLAQNVVLSGLNHGYEDVHTAPLHQAVSRKQITVEDEVWIGANAVITAGVKLGKHCVVGAGSVVTKDVPPFSIVVGNPARVVKYYDFDTESWTKGSHAVIT